MRSSGANLQVFKIHTAPCSTVEDIANRASSLKMSYGEYVASKIFIDDKVHYFPFINELKKLKRRRKSG